MPFPPVKLDAEQFLRASANPLLAALACRTIFGKEDVDDHDIVKVYCHNASILRYLPSSDPAFMVFFNDNNTLRRLAYTRAYFREKRRLAVSIQPSVKQAADAKDLAEIYKLPIIEFRVYAADYEPPSFCYEFTSLLETPDTLSEFLELARASSSKPLMLFDVSASPFSSHVDGGL